MTVYIGVDFHARQQTISYLTTEDGKIQRLQLDHGQPDEVRQIGVRPVICDSVPSSLRIIRMQTFTQP